MFDYLVTGGMGFIGRHTIAALKAEYPTADIVCLDNLSLSEKVDHGARVEFVNADVRDAGVVADLIAECRSGVIHLAADSRVLPSLEDPAKVIESAETNVLGTANILAAMAKTSPHLNLVYAGSSTAYGNGLYLRDRPRQNEHDLPAVQSPYSATKLAGEELIRSFVVTFGIKATVLRYFQVYGPGQPTTGAYALVTGIFLRQYFAGEPLTIEGDGAQCRDFIHVHDVARANIIALTKNSEGLPVNIGSGDSHSIKALADMISTNQTHLPPRRIDLKSTHADIGRAKRLLGWHPTIDLCNGISAMKVSCPE